ncbi:hypothetical protein LPJ61_003319 [Coemansia biformis]|uniref:Uncharacterized protein n=1 Tax=Coemansia biformis TaxID=1286918 RepID=A0A9W8CWD4_9FUNG|nr:hypothetical protein LPJ61_003319 [Coemansia biformis]
MSLEGLRREIAEAGGGGAGASQAPIGGRYIALLRRTAAGMLFSDPVHVADGQALPDLPDGVEYIVVHPYTAPARPQTLAEHLSTNALHGGARSEPEQRPVALPVLHDYGSFSSFLPGCDSSQTSLRAADYAVLNGCDDERRAEQRVTEAEVASAVEMARRALGDASVDGEAGTQAAISAEMLRDLGLTPADVGLGETEEPEPATAEEILRQNSAMLVQLVELQERRARSGDYGAVSAEERAVASKLHASLARVAGASAPRDLLPPSSEIQRTAKLLLASGRASFAGTLPPQRRFAFMSNVAGLGVPAGATAAPMQRAPPPK